MKRFIAYKVKREIQLAFICVLLFSITMPAFAERTRVATGGDITFDTRCGYNASFGWYGTAAFTAQYSLPHFFHLKGGIQYNSIQRIAAEVRPAYFYDFECGRIHAEILCHYNRQGAINTICVGGGIGFTMPYIWANLGYYYRCFGYETLSLQEPFNIYYELGVNCLPKVEKWDLMIAATNSTLYDVERHYQPSLVVKSWWYPTSSVGIMLGAAYKPAGMFNISSNHYQTYINVGVQYRW